MPPTTAPPTISVGQWVATHIRPHGYRADDGDGYSYTHERLGARRGPTREEVGEKAKEYGALGDVSRGEGAEAAVDGTVENAGWPRPLPHQPAADYDQVDHRHRETQRQGVERTSVLSREHRGDDASWYQHHGVGGNRQPQRHLQ